MTIQLPIAVLNESEANYAEDGNKFTSKTSEMLGMSKDGRKFLKFITPQAMKKANKSAKDKKPVMAYRFVAAEKWKEWSKPVGISVTIEDRTVIIDLFLKNGTVTGNTPIDMQDVDVDNLDNDFAKQIRDECVNVVARHYEGKKATVWNLGHDVDKWPEEVQSIATQAAMSSIKALSKLDANTDTAKAAEVISPFITKALDDAKALDISMEIFAYRFCEAITYTIFADYNDTEEAMEGLHAHMKEVEMKEHGYRFAPPQGTTMH